MRKIVDVRNKITRHKTKRFSTRNLSNITDIAVHYSATRSGNSASFANHHVNTNGWAGIGYHYVILKDGTVEYCGDINTTRANVGGNNSYVIGICLVGDFAVEKPTQAQLESAFQLIEYLQMNITTIKRIRGHNEFPNQTSPCPVINMNNFRTQYDSYLRRGDKVEIPNRKLENLKYLNDNKIVNDYEGWSKKIDDNMPAWAVFSIMANMHKVLLSDLKGVEDSNDKEIEEETKEPVNGNKEPLHSYGVIGTTHILKIKPRDLKVVIRNQAIVNIPDKTAVNGTFFWEGKPNGILVSEGKILSDQASHAWRGFPQSVVYMTILGEVKIKRIRLISEIFNEGIEWAIGGLGIVAPYGYNPDSEGFNGQYADVLRVANKTFIGYKKNEDLLYICIRPESSHDRIIQSVNNLKLDFAISLDGGGSSCMKVGNKVKVASNRAVNNYIAIKGE